MQDRAPDSPIAARILDMQPPLATGGWAIGERALSLVLDLIDRDGRELILECGSGISTIAIARLLRQRDVGHAWALEHDLVWAASTRERLEAEGLADLATVVEAPLEPGPPAQAGCGWYRRESLAQLPEQAIDLLLVDGPPAPAHEPALERSRYPALPLLAGRLAPGAAIICDDADRPGERWMVERWRDELNVTFEPGPGGTALAFWPGATP